MISKITALIIGTNYPENIDISTYESGGKHGFVIHLLRDGNIHGLLVSTGCFLDSNDAANNSAVELCESCLNDDFFGKGRSNEV